MQKHTHQTFSAIMDATVSGKDGMTRPTSARDGLNFIPQGWRAGQIGGVEIRLDVSLIFIAFFVAFVLASRIFPLREPGLSPAIYWLVGLFTAVVFIGSVLWHEMAHALVAMRYHIPVIKIVLHLFGGVAQIARDPERPSQEFWIAIAGPISSLVLAAIFGLLSGLPGLPGAASGWLATINLTLALFNLLPGFPLDGGRVLRALIWKVTGSYRRSTRLTSRIGQGVAGLFAVFGLFLMLRGGLFDGVWFLLIAAFIYAAATATYRMTGRGPLPLQTPVRRVMRFNVPIIEPSLPLALLAWRYLDHNRDQAFPVMERGVLVGMISAVEVDPIPRLEWGRVRVRDRMIPRDRLVMVRTYDDLQSALEALDAAQMNHALVFDSEAFVGMLNRRDIVYRT